MCAGQMHWHLQRGQRACCSHYPGPLGKQLEKKYLAIWTGVRLQNGSFLCDSLPRTDEREAYKQFSLPPSPKATAGKARALRPRGGSRSPPRKLQRSSSKTNQSPCESLSLAGHLHANGNQACQPVRLRPSAPRFTLFIKCTKYSLQGSPLAQRPCSPSLNSLRSAGKPTPKLGGSSSRIW